ncbi:MAG: aminotransferase class I/II-fold pyridoxal phosphate-dependent enzyme, partial [Bacteroidales bacterium]|nr:aminotransferase class I/II-fold pyridoxal phosphate-dependent enzyme [Bacteroidales bacterium]
VCYIPNPDLRKRFFGWLDALGVAGGNVFAFTAAEAAFAHGEDWLRQMLDYLNVNVRTLGNYLKENMPKVKVVLPEASYLAWLDFSAYGLSHEQLRDKLVNEARVALNDGTTFGGDAYRCCFRMNLGCPTQTLLEVLERIKEVVR